MKPLNLPDLLIRILQATPEQKALIDRILDGRLAVQRNVGAGSKSAENEAVSRNDEGYITKTTVALLTSMSLRSIDNQMKKGLPFYTLGRSVRFRFSEVQTYLTGHCRVSHRSGD